LRILLVQLRIAPQNPKTPVKRNLKFKMKQFES